MPIQINTPLELNAPRELNNTSNSDTFNLAKSDNTSPFGKMVQDSFANSANSANNDNSTTQKPCEKFDESTPTKIATADNGKNKISDGTTSNVSNECKDIKNVVDSDEAQKKVIEDNKTKNIRTKIDLKKPKIETRVKTEVAKMTNNDKDIVKNTKDLNNKKVVTKDKNASKLKSDKKSAANIDSRVAKNNESDKNVPQNIILTDALKTASGNKTASEINNIDNIDSNDDIVAVDTLDKNIINPAQMQSIQNNASKVGYLDKDKKIKITDERKIPNQNTNINNQSQKARVATAKITNVGSDEKGNPQLTMDLNANTTQNQVQDNITSLNSQSAAANGSTFQAMLTNQITQSAPDFVRAGNIILRDNDAGQIKLVLHPDNLGDVKIDLQLNDKILTGKIVVASNAAFEAFQDSSDSLKQAFVASGFETADFDLSFNGGNAQNSAGQNNNENQQIFSRMGNIFGEVANQSADNFIGDGLAAYYNGSRKTINIVA